MDELVQAYVPDAADLGLTYAQAIDLALVRDEEAAEQLAASVKEETELDTEAATAVIRTNKWNKMKEFETRIFNNTKMDGNTIPLTVADVVPGQFRDTGYTSAEVDNIDMLIIALQKIILLNKNI